MENDYWWNILIGLEFYVRVKLFVKVLIIFYLFN